MLRSLLPPDFFKLPKYTVSKPITVTAVSIRLALRSDAPSHVSLILLLPSARPTFFFFFFFHLPVFFPAWVFCYPMLLCNWSFHLSFRYMSLFPPHLCTCCCWPSTNPNPMYSFWRIMGSSLLSALMVRTSDFKIDHKLYWYRNRNGQIWI